MSQKYLKEICSKYFLNKDFGHYIDCVIEGEFVVEISRTLFFMEKEIEELKQCIDDRDLQLINSDKTTKDLKDRLKRSAINFLEKRDACHELSETIYKLKVEINSDYIKCKKCNSMHKIIYNNCPWCGRKRK